MFEGLFMLCFFIWIWKEIIFKIGYVFDYDLYISINVIMSLLFLNMEIFICNFFL